MEKNMKKEKNLFTKNSWLADDVQYFKYLTKQKETAMTKEKRQKLEKTQEKVLKNNVTFEKFGEPKCHHIFVESHGILECIFCGHTTLEYSIDLEEALYLIMAATVQDLLVRNATKEDIPLLRRILKAQKENPSLVLEKARDYEKVLLTLKTPEPRRTLSSQEALSFITKTEEEKNILEETLRKLKSVQKPTEEQQRAIEFHELAIEECLAVQYETMILEGENPVKLFENASNEKDKFAALKAYYNLYREQFRVSSAYFKTEEDAKKYVCLAGNPKIEQMILDKRIKREN